VYLTAFVCAGMGGTICLLIIKFNRIGGP
jgi:hypothetical protein